MRHAAIVLALAGLSLAGCFVSKAPLIDGSQAALPYAKIVYAEQGSRETTTLIRQGSAYLLEPKSAESDGHIRFLKVADDLYVAQLEIVEDEAAHYLYGLLKVDLPGRTVASYKAVAGDADKTPGPGLSHCNEKDLEQVCIRKTNESEPSEDASL